MLSLPFSGLPFLPHILNMALNSPWFPYSSLVDIKVGFKCDWGWDQELGFLPSQKESVWLADEQIELLASLWYLLRAGS